MAVGVSGSVRVRTRPVEVLLMRMASNMSDPGMVQFIHAVAGVHFRRRARARFAGEGDDAVGGWAPLKDSTQQIKRNLGLGRKKINVRTGHLRDTITNEMPQVNYFGPLGVGFSMPNQPDRPDLYWRMLQSAGMIRGGPARPVVGHDSNDMLFLLTALRSWSMRGVREIP